MLKCRHLRTRAGRGGHAGHIAFWLTRILALHLHLSCAATCLQVLLLLSAVLLTAAPSSAHRMLAQAPAFVPELQAAAHQALAPSFQAAVPTLQAVAEQLPASLPVDSKTKSLIQTAVSDLFSAIAYTGGDQQKLSQTQAARPEPGWRLRYI